MRHGSEEAARTYTEAWCADGEIGYVELAGGGRLRYLRAGSGPQAEPPPGMMRRFRSLCPCHCRRP